MKNPIQNKILTGLFILLVWSCTDKKWDDYYVSPGYLKDGSTFEVLTKNPDYKEFTSLLKKTGCDSLLSRHDVYTVFAPRNGAFTGIDTITDLVALKKTLGMQILPSAVFKAGMEGSKLAVSGKLLKFATTPVGATVNSILITKFDTKTSNGVIHETGNVILPAPNLYDAIIAAPDLSAFKDFISSSYKSIIDPVNNIKIGYDTLNKPIYQEPVNYIQSSEYLKVSHLQDEDVLSTGFFPSNKAVSKVISDMLVARNGRMDLIVPRLGKFHGDTIVGGRFFRRDTEYPGDTAVLLNDLFTSVFVSGEIPRLTGNSNSFTNIAGNRFTVTKDQVKTDARVASNGYYYVLDDVTVPDTFYRKEFWFLPTPKVQDPADSTKTINNPDIIYSNEANSTPAVLGGYTNFGVLHHYISYTGKYTKFNFTKVGAMIDFIIPYVTKGYYKVELSYFPASTNGIVSASYGSQQLFQDLNTGTEKNNRALRYCVKDMGTINVVDHGPVQIKFTCTNSNLSAFNNYYFCVDYLRLIPVPAP
ncbi:MAG: fasciclin domain-containing protein [Bacteroidetes bacterium]|nr:fasciclin domain-containing protein [Bacteroidota bacterium]MCL6102623.1 fasciclin domain-containing protein [Bacteroidota bacterium]